MKKGIFKIFTLTVFIFVVMINFASAKGYRESDLNWQYLILGMKNRTVVEEHLSADLNSKEFAQEVLDLVNKERRQRGIAPLRLSSDLLEAAEIRAEEISRVFSHTRPNGKSCHSMFRNGQYTIGENIAAGSSTPERVVEQWMDSSGHRANILNADYTELGVGYYYKSKSEYKHYWVQIFRRPMPKPIIIHR